MADAPLKVWMEDDGKLLRLRLNRPKANLIDMEMMNALHAVYMEHCSDKQIHAIILDHEGPNFSFGASVEEHLPGKVSGMLREMQKLIERMLTSRVVFISCIKGHCLGAGLEVALAGSIIFAAHDAQLASPEIRLGIFAPAASALLPERVGQGRAHDLLLSGRSVSGDDAYQYGLVDFVAKDPVEAALEYYQTHLSPLSASSLRYAIRAAKEEYAARVLAQFSRVEDLYLAGLMGTRDGVEGLEAFMEKRDPKWTHR